MTGGCFCNMLWNLKQAISLWQKVPLADHSASNHWWYTPKARLSNVLLCLHNQLVVLWSLIMLIKPHQFRLALAVLSSLAFLKKKEKRKLQHSQSMFSPPHICLVKPGIYHHLICLHAVLLCCARLTSFNMCNVSASVQMFVVLIQSLPSVCLNHLLGAEQNCDNSHCRHFKMMGLAPKVTWKKFQMCLMKICSNCKLYQKSYVQKIKIKEQPQHWKQIMLSHILYSISLTNYHIKKRPFTTNYLVAKKCIHLLLLPSTAQPDELLKKSKFFTHTGCTFLYT